MVIIYPKRLKGWLDYSCKRTQAVYDDIYAWSVAYLHSKEWDLYLLLRNRATGLAVLHQVMIGDDELSTIDDKKISTALNERLTAYGFDGDDLAFYLKEGEEITFSDQFESAYERKKLKDLETWVMETGFAEAMQTIGDLEPTINRRKVDAKALFAKALSERRGEKTKDLYSAISVKITLRMPKEYPVWRRFHIPTDLSYGDLHTLIQVAFGWDGSHLHEFRLGSWARIMPAYDIERDFCWDDAELYDEDEVTIRELNQKKMVYIYDFGDDWTHDITLEKILSVEEEPKPICVDGFGSSPWEDCGGPWGYAAIRDGLDDPDSLYRSWALEWLGLEDKDEDDLDLDDEDLHGVPFSLAVINAGLRHRLW